jgi:pimeloyl-ACP methyl ester carboxylesterase
MPSVTANNVKINYIEQGAGDEAIVFIHGIGASIKDWSEVFERLPEEYHAYALDQRGHGQSEKPGSYQLTEMVEDIYAFTRELGIGRFTYVGHSMGGTLGLRFALDYLKVLKAMVLVAPFAVHEWLTPDMQAPLLAMGFDDYPSAMKVMFGMPDMVGGVFSSMFATPPNKERLNELVQDAVATDPAAIGDCYTWMLSSGLEPRLGDIRIPTLIVAGEKDSTPVDALRSDASRIKGCRFEVFEDSGHFPPIESTQKFVDLLTGFIKDANTR